MAGLFDQSREKAKVLTGQATEWVEGRRDDGGLVEVATQLYERDRDAFGTVLGSALALRLFLFVVPADIAVFGLINVFNLDRWATPLTESPTTGEVATRVFAEDWAQSLWIFLSAMVLTLWAGRSLARVLATCSASSWQLPARQAKVKVKGIAAVSGLFFALLLASMLIGRLRRVGGFPVTASSWVLVALVMGTGWFLLTMSLPRRTTDPGALLPGAILVAVAFAGLSWFMHIYLPDKITRMSETYGSLAISVATLGYFFSIGRLLAGAITVNAVVFERFGSLSHYLFAVPGLRAIPRRWPAVARYFDLDGAQRADVLEGQESVPA
jgi:uncharacterized BrkB/YihY/UPF0761 family membrane protein